MNAILSERVEALFDTAKNLPITDRKSFLDQECGTDEGLRRDVESLLTASESANSFFSALANRFGLTSVLSGDAELPEHNEIGAYRLLRLIGRGGMGAVYLAERADQQFNKLVALKVLPFGVGGEAARRRFLAERQILAQLLHPNIARLLDGGITDRGTPYFVMDYVAGEPIDFYCDENQLDIDARLALFCQVGEAVQYAHRNLVVHRDLKPANVLVENTGEVKLVDFGIAKTLYPDDNARLTRTGLLPMTSLYASPEMLKQEPVTTLSDVYALGVLLYELLTGRHPYGLKSSASGPDLWRHICELDPLAPSKAALEDGDADLNGSAEERGARRKLTPKRLHQRLRGDLDTIIAKAMRKDPEQRYGSIERLLDDIRRHLSGLPVLAQRPTVAYRMRKFVMRRKGLVAAGLASVGFVLTVAYQSNQTLHEAERANREAHIAQQVSDFLVSIFDVSRPERALGNTITAREILDRGADEISQAAIDDPEVQGRLMSTIGSVYERLALYTEAEALLDDAINVQRRNLGEDHRQTLLSMSRLGYLYLKQGRFEEAEEMLSKTIAHQRRVLDNDHAETLDSLHKLTIAHAQQGDFVTAAKLGEEVLAARRRVLGPDDPETLKTINNLAIFYKMQGHADRAEALYLELLETHTRLLEDNHPQTMAVLQNLADLYSDQGRYDDAEPMYVKAIEMGHRLYGAEHPDVTRAMINLANMYQAMGQFGKAEQLYVDTVAIQRKTLGNEHYETLNGIQKLGELYTRQERYAEAKELLEEAVAGHRKTLGAGHAKTLEALRKLIDLNIALGNDSETRSLTTELLIQSRQLAERDNASPEDKNNFAWILLTCEPEDLRDPITALRYSTAANVETHESEPNYLRTLALAYHRTGDSERAVQAQRQAIGLLPQGASQLHDTYTSALIEYEGSPAGAVR